MEAAKRVVIRSGAVRGWRCRGDFGNRQTGAKPVLGRKRRSQAESCGGTGHLLLLGR